MQRSQSPKQVSDDARKVFITNIDGLQPEDAVQNQLRRLFSRHGKVTKLNVKKNKNGLYSFAFLQFQKADEAGKAIGELDQYELFGKRMRVRQDRQSQGCFHCKKSGHFARQCPQNKDKEGKPKEYNDRNRDSNRDYRQRDDRYDKQRQYRDDRHKDDRYDRRYRDERDDKRQRRDRRDRSRSYSYQYKRRGGGYNSRSDSGSRSRDRRYRRQPRHDRYYEDRRRDRREDRRGEYYRSRRSYSSRSYS